MNNLIKIVSREWNISHVREVIKEEKMEFIRGLTDEECKTVIDETLKYYEPDEYVIQIIGEKQHFKELLSNSILNLFRSRMTKRSQRGR